MLTLLFGVLSVVCAVSLGCAMLFKVINEAIKIERSAKEKIKHFVIAKTAEL